MGIDIGSSTSHLMFSQLTVGFPSVHQRRPEILERQVISRSPVTLTPFTENWNLDAEPLRALVDRAFRDARLTPDAIDTGAVIITGEAARRDNAQKIAEMFSDEAGRFVCATAGPKLEAVLAAHGSGAVSLSREHGLRLLHVDVGGGTTKVNIIERGTITQTAAYNVGARLVAYDDGTLVRIEHAGARFLRDVGRDLRVGDRIDEVTRTRVAERMASVLLQVLHGGSPPWDDLLVTPPLRVPTQIDGAVFSGGVSEYIYEREQAAYGDLGPFLGRELRAQAEARRYRIFDSSEGIRATVIGASEYSVQLSGETIFIPDPQALPVHNLRTFVARVTWDPPVAERARQAVAEALGARDPEVSGSAYALVIASPPFSGYGAAQEVGEGIRRALSEVPAEDRPAMLVFEQNIGQVLGRVLGPELPIPCIDEVNLSELDFIDVGTPVPGEAYVPVVVKSLAFGV